MNKLDVALKLIKLLNERKCIDSNLVANELNVSLRTAQRYLCDLSSLPCVSGESNHKYHLVPEYRLDSALLNNVPSVPQSELVKKYLEETLKMGEVVCKVCGNECELHSRASG